MNHFIVSVPKTHEDSIITSSGVEIAIDPKWNQFEHRVCYGEIVSVPEKHDTGAQLGDTLFFHHHVTTSANLNAGESMYAVFYDDKNGYNGHGIAYRRRSDGVLIMLSDWVFMTPVEEKPEDRVSSTGVIVELGIHNKTKRRATIHTANEELLSYGVLPGDVVGFDVNSDYRMKLDNGDVVYRMKAKDISYVEAQQ